MISDVWRGAIDRVRRAVAVTVKSQGEGRGMRRSARFGPVPYSRRQMDIVDLGIGMALILAGALGLYWGVLRQMVALAGLAAGLAVAGRYGSAAGDALGSFVNDPAVAGAGGTLAVLAAVSGTASLLASLVHLYAGLLFLGRLDHGLGAVLGVLYAALLIAALTLVGTAYPSALWDPIVDRSTFAPLLVELFGPVVAPLLRI